MSGKAYAGTKTLDLFIPCLVDQIYPEIGIAVCDVLEKAGFQLRYNPEHTCCGQPAFNSGQRAEAKHVAAAFIRTFRHAETIVSLSGSCTAMVRHYYPVLFAGTPLEEDAKYIAARIWEFSQLLVYSGAEQFIGGRADGVVALHNSCHSARELRIKEEPYRLLKRVQGCKIVQPAEDQVCCGFGGVFCVKHPAISEAMAKSRLAYFEALGADTVVANDPGCVMQLRREASAEKSGLHILHLAEFLAGAMNRADEPAVCHG